MIILEGTDAVGKTSVINKLHGFNHVIVDRDKNICKYIDFNISLIDRVTNIVSYLNTIDDIVIFLINNNKEELEKRIEKRGIIDEYDKFAYLYNLLYLETYIYIKQNNLADNLYMVDCTDLNMDEQVDKVKQLILKVER